MATLSPGAPRGIEHRADAGQHRAAEQRGDFGRDVAGDLDRRARVDDRVAGERRDAEVMVHRRAALAQPETAAQQFALAVRRRTVGAQIALTRRAGGAVAAGGQERQHHAVAGREIAFGVAGFEHRRCRLMPQRHRHRPDAVAVDHRQVRMTQAGGVDADEQLAGAGRGEVELGQRQRAAVANGPAAPVAARTAAVIFMGEVSDGHPRESGDPSPQAAGDGSPLSRG